MREASCHSLDIRGTVQLKMVSRNKESVQGEEKERESKYSERKIISSMCTVITTMVAVAAAAAAAATTAASVAATTVRCECLLGSETSSNYFILNSLTTLVSVYQLGFISTNADSNIKSPRRPH